MLKRCSPPIRLRCLSTGVERTAGYRDFYLDCLRKPRSRRLRLDVREHLTALVRGMSWSDQLDSTVPLIDLGIDSLAWTDFAAELRQLYRRALSRCHQSLTCTPCRSRTSSATSRLDEMHHLRVKVKIVYTLLRLSWSRTMHWQLRDVRAPTLSRSQRVQRCLSYLTRSARPHAFGSHL